MELKLNCLADDRDSVIFAKAHHALVVTAKNIHEDPDEDPAWTAIYLSRESQEKLYAFLGQVLGKEPRP